MWWEHSSVAGDRRDALEVRGKLRPRGGGRGKGIAARTSWRRPDEEGEDFLQQVLLRPYRLSPDALCGQGRKHQRAAFFCSCLSTFKCCRHPFKHTNVGPKVTSGPKFA